MKKILVLLTLTLFIGCIPSAPLVNKYNEGDILYIKPDSTKVVVTYVYNIGKPFYKGAYTDKLGVMQEYQFNEYEVYETIKND